jgi:hypothetical protein
VKQKIVLSLILLLSAAHVSSIFGTTGRPGKLDERYPSYRIRTDAAYYQTLAQPYYDMTLNNNGDETNVPNYAGNFTKLLPHDPTLGTATTAGQASYELLIQAMNTGDQTDFNAIQFTSGCQRKFINPQAGFAFTLLGRDSSLFSMSQPPKLNSAQAAADMLETYMKAICRDVQFQDYGTGTGTDDDGTGHSITAKAALVLDDLSAYQGPKNGSGHVDTTVLFRGTTAGDKVGPYVSQFLLQSFSPLFPSGCAGFVAALIGVQNLPQDVLMVKQLYPIAQKREFGVSWPDFVSIENGLIPKQYSVTVYDASNLSYLINGRDMGGYVHQDGPYSPYYNALNILAGHGFPISATSPYSNGDITNEAAGFDMGVPDAYSLIGHASLEAFKAAWAQKWRVHRRLRPEAMAGLVHRAKTTSTNPYNLDSSLFTTHNSIDPLALVLAYNQKQSLISIDPAQLLSFSDASTYLLSQMFPEGSPAHPSYPAGHAVVAGACTTVIKAIFDDTALMNAHVTPAKPNPSNPIQLIALSGEGETTMTVGSELDKLASNIALARNFGGVHYRSDGDNGILLGEEVGIHVLQDHARTYPESGFTGFELTKRDGTRIRITAEDVTVIDPI